MKNYRTQNGFVRAAKKFFLSAFVVVSFAAYALENRASDSGAIAASGATDTTPPGTPAGSAAPATVPSSAPGAPAGAADAPAVAAPAAEATTSSGPAATAPAAPTATSGVATAAAPTAAVNAGSGYKDGTYTGPSVDVNWGNVQVQATIKNGKISNVQFLQYPSDRRTSQRINSIADPQLQQEAIQAQSANVDIISGATLTSEGFQMSLQSALSQAKG